MPEKEKGTEKEYNPADIFSLSLIGIGDVVAKRVLDYFHEPAKDIIERILLADPYELMRVEGVNFVRADTIAKTFFAVKENDPRRLAALILKIIDDNKNFGHTFLPKVVLEKELSKFKVPMSMGEPLLENLELRGLIHIEDENKIYLSWLHKCEVEVAEYIRIRAGFTFEANDISHEFEEDDKEQETAINSFSFHNLFIITGGPGTGKTYTVKKICELLEQNFGKSKIALCAPTGKAAKRLSELTGRSASTIHRLLKAGWGTWGYNASNQLEDYAWIVIDEASMIDLELAWRFLSAIPLDTNLIFVGDVDQLPPVGPGSFFRDLLKYKEISSVRLKTNHRQGKGSLIAHNALLINSGGMKLTFGDDLQFHELNPIDIRSKITEFVQGLKDDGYDPIRDIQVLSPQKETIIGVKALNEVLRFELNPNANANEKFSVGDKVMQIVNDYNLGVYNGYLGVIQDENSRNYEITFLGEEGEETIYYPKKYADSLMLAYASTIHKFQGSECKSGIVIISTTHTYMLNRNLLYTGMTRFKEKCLILGDVIGLKRAVTNTRENERWSRLLLRLEEVI